ncbi:sensor histidine kinase [Roseateles violae]|uniref:Histidine kinase n=1 Tax=Roseateles violae TaxID=3058042 RepID=A0ABT8DSF6_9BURK|nr:histidine kinase [Pelomonas sp. PFR6]MDN3919965.1 histidine kinase [Pelomonas sp. PFR6]
MSVPKAETVQPKPPPVSFDDRPLMACGSLAFGLTIPWISNLYGPLTAREPVFWLGLIGFVALAGAIWWGNRWLLFKQREHLNWFAHPLRKLMMLVSANVLYTAPLTVAALLAWFWIAGLAVDVEALKLVVATNVICVLFVTHAYETMFLIRERESDMLRVERLERARAQAELAALKAQLDPHFLFNSLNTLGHLIASKPALAREFSDTLAEIYRYVLDSRQRDLVPLDEELAFLRHYHRLLALRFGAAVPLQLDPALQTARWQLPPLALQTLMENAIKHNEASLAQPLRLDFSLAGDAVQVRNALRPRRSALPSPGLGLANLDERCRLLSGRALERRREDGVFEVRIPLVPLRPLESAA